MSLAVGNRSTDPADLPSEVTAYAMRDLDALQRKAFAHGQHVGTYAAAVLEHPLPWTKMRQVYRLLGLVRRHGPDRIDQACRRGLEAEVVNIGLIVVARSSSPGPVPNTVSCAFGVLAEEPSDDRSELVGDW